MVWRARGTGTLFHALTEQKKLEEAWRLIKMTHEAQVKVLGPDHRDTMLTSQSLAMA